MNRELVNRIQQCPTLPSLPTVAIQVLDLAQKAQVDIAEIAHVISKDPALSSKILRTVNSSFYGRSQSVSTITHALVILGLQSVKSLVLGFSLVTNLNRDKGKGFKHLTYWRRSIYAATAARTIAAKLNLVQQEECFLAALLMDIGMLVLDQVLGENYGEIVEKASSHSEIAALEKAALGMTHAEATGVLAEEWKLPPLLTEPMKAHHEPQVLEDPTLMKLAEVIYLAGRCADVFVAEQPAEAIAEVRAFCQSHYQIKPDDCDAMLNEIGVRTQEIAPLFDIHVASSQNYSDILKRANEALVQITLLSQQQASQLKVQNQQLQQQATTDPLTGLSNRARFDEFIQEQFALATRQHKPLSMLLLDADHFKKVNDQYGHQIGDQVLRILGGLLKRISRPQDLAVRYGGEEFVLLLPGINRVDAAKIAETIRSAIATRPVPCGKTPVPLTVSIGVASHEPGKTFPAPEQLVRAADLAAYAAKRGGRNCVRIYSPKPTLKPAAA